MYKFLQVEVSRACNTQTKQLFTYFNQDFLFSHSNNGKSMKPMCSLAGMDILYFFECHKDKKDVSIANGKIIEKHYISKYYETSPSSEWSSFFQLTMATIHFLNS